MSGRLPHLVLAWLWLTNLAVGHGDRDSPVPGRSGRPWVCGAKGKASAWGPDLGLPLCPWMGGRGRGSSEG